MIDEKSLENLKPFKKAISGNPAGKPKGSKNIRTLLKKYLLLEMDMEHPATGEMEKISLLEAGILKMIKQYMEGDDRARKEIFDRFYGKVPDVGKVEYSGELNIVVKLPDRDK